MLFRSHAGPVEIFGALTGVNQDVQKLDIMDGGHGLDLLDLRFQRNTPVSLLVCRNPYVPNRLCWHILEKLDHMSGGSHKLSGYLHQPWGESAKTPGGEPAEASRRRHTETQQRQERASENSPPKKGQRGEPPWTAVAGVAEAPGFACKTAAAVSGLIRNPTHKQCHGGMFSAQFSFIMVLGRRNPCSERLASG